MPPDPHLRPFLEYPPDYGNDETLFTTEVHHSGFFWGLREDLCYIQASVEHWDHCCTDTWSILWMNDLLKQMGYERDGRMNIYWSPPGKDLNDGLVCIETDAHVVAMLESVSVDKTVVLFLDHTNFLKCLRDDKIISADNTAAQSEMPRKVPAMPIASDGEGTCGAARGPSSKEKNIESETFEDFVHVEDNSEESEDSDWIDSDCEAADGDDDLFAANVDKDVQDNNEHVAVEDLEDDAPLEDGDLNLREEVQGHLQNRFKAFNAEVDMNNPEFKVGMVFSDVKEIRQALQNYTQF